MSSHYKVGREAEQARALEGELRSNGAKAADALGERARALGVKLRANWTLAMEDVQALLAAAVERALASDTAHVVATGTRASPATERDDAARELCSCAVLVRQALAARYGEHAIVTAFPRGATPRDPAKLLLYVRHAVHVIRDEGASWTVLHENAVPVDVAAAAARLEALAKPVDAALHAVAGTAGAGHATLTARDADLFALHDLRLGAQHLFVGALEAAGLDELAHRITVHHHVHAAPTEPAGLVEATPAPLTAAE